MTPISDIMSFLATSAHGFPAVRPPRGLACADPRQPGPMSDRLAVFDLDGVLADVRHRVHHVEGPRRDWDAFFAEALADPPLADGLEAVAVAEAEGLAIAYLTGRPERCRADTEAWLDRVGLPPGPLLMRPDRDRRPARMFKVEALRDLARTTSIAYLVDDDAAVVLAASEAGFPVIHAAWMGGGTEGVDRILYDVQETEGRT